MATLAGNSRPDDQGLLTISFPWGWLLNPWFLRGGLNVSGAFRGGFSSHEFNLNFSMIFYWKECDQIHQPQQPLTSKKTHGPFEQFKRNRLFSLKYTGWKSLPNNRDDFISHEMMDPGIKTNQDVPWKVSGRFFSWLIWFVSRIAWCFTAMVIPIWFVVLMPKGLVAPGVVHVGCWPSPSRLAGI